MVLEGQVRTRGMLGGGTRKEEGGEGGNEIREKRGVLQSGRCHDENVRDREEVT